MKLAIIVIACIAIATGLLGAWVANRPGSYSGDYGNSMLGGIIMIIGAILGVGDLLVAIGWTIFR